MIDRMKELHYIAEDRLAKEKLAEDDETKRLEAIEQEKQRLAEQSRTRTVSWNTSTDNDCFQSRTERFHSTTKRSEGPTSKRQSSFDERFDELCREANQPTSSRKARKVVSWNDDPGEPSSTLISNERDSTTKATTTPSHCHQLQKPSKRRNVLDAYDSDLPYSDCIAPIAVAVGCTPSVYSSIEGSSCTVPSKSSLPVPLMRTNKPSQSFVSRRYR